MDLLEILFNTFYMWPNKIDCLYQFSRFLYCSQILHVAALFYKLYGIIKEIQSSKIFKFCIQFQSHICSNWLCNNQSYHPWQQIWFFFHHELYTILYMNKQSYFTFKTSYILVVCFCWLLFCSTGAICMSGLGSKWQFS